jgi:hypothetical protein
VGRANAAARLSAIHLPCGILVTFLILISLKNRDARACENLPCAITHETRGKRRENEVYMLVHIGANMGQMRTPIWKLWTSLTNVHICRGLVMNLSDAQGRLARWRLRLAEFTLKVYWCIQSELR